MRFFHLSDLHIGKQLYNYSLIKEQEAILNQIVAAAEDEVKNRTLDAILICGDIYDKSVPSAEAVSLFDIFLTKLNRIEPQIPLFIIAGNHDSGERLDYGGNILCNNQIYFSGLPPKTKTEYLRKVTLKDAFGEVNFYMLPFMKPFFVRNVMADEETNMSYEKAVIEILKREEIDDTKRNVLLAHQFFVAGGKNPQTSDSEIKMLGGIDSVDVGAVKEFDYVALGHIHKPQAMGMQKIRYCGTPLAYSLSEENQLKSITVVDLFEKEKEPFITTIPLEPIHHVRSIKGTLEDVLKQASVEGAEDYISITLTDEIDPYRPKERLEEVFHHILEIRVDNNRTRTILSLEEKEVELSEPYEVFEDFFEDMMRREMSLEEQDYIRKLINEVKEA